MSAVIQMTVPHRSEMKVTKSTEGKGIQNVQIHPYCAYCGSDSFPAQPAQSPEFIGIQQSNKTCHYPADTGDLIPIIWYVIRTMRYIYLADGRSEVK